MEEDNGTENFTEIPLEKISPFALNALVEEFILREGTDYGHSESTLGEKKQKIMQQLKSGFVKIVFSNRTEDTTILLSSEIGSVSL